MPPFRLSIVTALLGFFLIACQSGPAPAPDATARPSWVDDKRKVVDTDRGLAFRAVGSAEIMLGSKMQSDRAKNRAVRRLGQIFRVMAMSTAKIYIRAHNEHAETSEPTLMTGPKSHALPSLQSSLVEMGPTWQDPVDKVIYAQASVSIDRAYQQFVTDVPGTPSAKDWLRKNKQSTIATVLAQMASEQK